MKEMINKVVNGQDLSEEEARQTLDAIMSGNATDAQIACFITALRIKGETVDEITGFVRVMREKATPVKTTSVVLIDTCGTGGDGAQTFNISTTVAFVVAGAGVSVAKHGNRSVSSRSGSADVLEALGVNLSLTPDQVGECIDKVGIGFLFAPALHGAMKHAIGPRREIGIRTVFNILGPLTNPAGALHQVLGVYNPDLTEVMAQVLARLGTKSAFVVHGAGGLDEVSVLGTTKVSEVKDGKVITYQIDPKEFGLEYAGIEQLIGGTAKENADITMNILEGEKGPKRDIVLLNAALALVAAGSAENISEGLKQAAQAIDSGLARAKLNEMIDFTKQYAPQEAQVC
jgi:anthranilate phosphoribosyltransferase